jgi:uncharacterized Zn finger protein (UPF0148 family)
MAREQDYDEQAEYDRIFICRRCGAVCDPRMDHCPVCERKVTQDRSKHPRAQRDLVAAFRRTFGSRLSDWLNEDVQEDADTAEDLREATFDLD